MDGHVLSDNRFCGGTGGIKYYCSESIYKGCSSNKKCQLYSIPALFGGKSYTKANYKTKVKECEAAAADPWNY